jgi:hypothetical protein
MLDEKFQEQLFEVIGRSRAASVAKLPPPRAYFMDKDGKIVSEPIVEQKDPCVSMTLGTQGKAASVTAEGINKAKAIHDFIFSNGTRW